MRLGVLEDGRVEESGIKEGSLIAGGVRPGKVPTRETPEPLGLIVTSQLAGPNIVGCTYGRRILGEGCEDKPIAGRRVPKTLSVCTCCKN